MPFLVHVRDSQTFWIEKSLWGLLPPGQIRWSTSFHAHFHDFSVATFAAAYMRENVFWIRLEEFITSQCLSAPTVGDLLVQMFKLLVKVLSFCVLQTNKECIGYFILHFFLRPLPQQDWLVSSADFLSSVYSSQGEEKQISKAWLIMFKNSCIFLISPLS